MKYFKIIFLFLLLFMPKVNAKEDIDIYLFHSSTCQHCQAEIKYLNELKNEYPTIELHLYETFQNKENDKLMQDIKQKLNIKNNQVPFTIIGTTYYIGFEDSIKESIDKLITKELENKSEDVIEKILNNEDISNIKVKNGEIDTIHTIFGDIDLNNISLPFLSIIIGFIDGFNPCAMWVLLFLISMLLGMKNRRKMWTIGLTFIITSAITYLFFMFAWLQVAITLTQVNWVRFIIGLIALLGGAINLTSYYKERKKDNGCQVVDSKKRKSITKKMKNIISLVDDNSKSFIKSEKKFLLALLGVIGLAISVNIVELACSSGLPLIFTQVLALNNLSTLQYILYIILYILFFLIDDIVIFVIAMTTLKVTGISTKYNKLSHLIGGIIMLLIGILMIFKPGWLMFNF